jgi:hypothetical protein
MANILNNQGQSATKASNCQPTKITTSYRGFNSIDQEIEREIAMQWFTSSHKNNISQRNFLLKKESL